MFLNIGLLSQCNLKCKFCYCKQDKPFNLSLIDSIPDRILQCLQQNNIHQDRYDIAIVGGELFMDGLSDDVFNVYNQFIIMLQNRLSEYDPGCTFQLHCYSNGVYNKIDRVVKFLQKWNSEIVLSYDTIDRFTNDRQRDLMLQNLEIFCNTDNITVCPTVVLFKQQDMKSFLNTDKFDKLYNLSGVDYQECMPDIYNIKPTDIVDFYIECLNRRLFKIENIKTFLQSLAFQMIETACKRSLTYYEDKAYIGCHYTKSDFVDMKHEVYQKYGCLQCDYFRNCQGICWVYGLFGTNGYCVNKRIFEYLDQHPEIVEDYKQYVISNGSNSTRHYSNH